MTSPCSPATVSTSNLLVSPFPPHLPRRSFVFPRQPFPRSTLCFARLGFVHHDFQPELAGLVAKAERFLYTVADAAVSSSSSSPDLVAADSIANQNSDWLSGITDYLETVLKVLKDGLSALHLPYAYGFAIILLTVLVKAATFPLTKKQVESAMAMRSLQPRIRAIQQRYAGDKERIQLETARLYKLAGINPLAGCLPTLATIPVWIGLYRALSNVANEGLLTEGFFWIPSLAGPTTIAARQNGSGISWIFPFIGGHPPLGWSDTLSYLVLPVLLVLSQYISVQTMQSSQRNDPNMESSQVLTKFLPLMIGYFALSVPSGLSLYWLTNNILSTAQQVWLQKLGGAKNPLQQFSEDENKREGQGSKAGIQVISNRKDTQVVKLVPEGLRPGERFKQLKEAENKRKRERALQRLDDEEKARQIQVTEEQVEIEVSPAKREEDSSSDIDELMRNHQYYNNSPSSSYGGLGVNGEVFNDELSKKT